MQPPPRPPHPILPRAVRACCAALVAVAAATFPASHAHTEEPPPRERDAVELAVAAGTPLELAPARRWRWTLWALQALAGEPVADARLAAQLAPFADDAALAPALTTLADDASAPLPPAAPLRVALARASSNTGPYPLFDADPMPSSPPPRRTQADAPTPDYRPFDAPEVRPRDRTVRQTPAPAVSGDPTGRYRPFDATVSQVRVEAPTATPAADRRYRAFDAEPEPGATTTTASPPCVEDWSELSAAALAEACRASSSAEPSASAAAVGASVLLYPVTPGTRRVRDLRLEVDGAGSWTLASEVPVAVAEVELGAAPGVVLELTAARADIDPFGPLGELERVYVLADVGAAAAARARFASAADAVCGGPVRCVAHALEHRDGVTIGLVHVVPEGLERASLLPGAWIFQMARGSSR